MRHLRVLCYQRGYDKDWSIFVPLVQRMINATVHSATNIAPSSMMFGNAVDVNRHLIATAALPAPKGFTHSEYLKSVIDIQKQLYETAEGRRDEIREIRKKKDTSQSNILNVGDLVLLLSRTGKRQNKLAPLKTGPYLVTSVDAKTNTYALENPADGKVLPRVHASQITEFEFDASIFKDDESIEHMAEDIASKDDPLIMNVANIEDHIFATKAKDGQLDVKPKSFVKNASLDSRRKHSYFLVQWEGYPDSKDFTWESYHNLRDNGPCKEWIAAHPECRLEDE